MGATHAASETLRAESDPASGTGAGVWAWVVPWAGVTLAAAVVATTFDVFLLQYRRSYFTGGFLARDYVTSLPEALAFFAGSLVTDAAAMGVVVWATLWVLGRLAVRRYLALVAAFAIALAPVLVANFIEYQLMTYLGDAFDLRLLFDLAGRSPGELVAVASAHVTRVLWVAVGVGVPAAVALWIVLRRVPRGNPTAMRTPSWSSLLAPVAVFIVGAIVMTLLRSGSDVLDNGLRRKPTGQILGFVVQAATDVDGDGYGALSRPADPNLVDRDVRPVRPRHSRQRHRRRRCGRRLALHGGTLSRSDP